MKLLSELFYLIGVQLAINTVTGEAVIRTVLFNWCAACQAVTGEAVIRTVLFKPINTVTGGAVIRTVLFNWCAACRQ